VEEYLGGRLSGHRRHGTCGLQPLVMIQCSCARQVTQVGEVIAVIVALKHGLGQTQDLLLASDVSESSQVCW